jgi:hypothetical protein
MIKVSTAALLISLAWATTGARAEGGYNTTAAFIEEYGQGENILPRLYIRGVFDGIGMSNALESKLHGTPMYCQPDKFAMVDAQYVHMMKDFVNKTPNAAKFPPASVLLFTLKDAFPCP